MLPKSQTLPIYCAILCPCRGKYCQNSAILMLILSAQFPHWALQCPCIVVTCNNILRTKCPIVIKECLQSYIVPIMQTWTRALCSLTTKSHIVPYLAHVESPSYSTYIAPCYDCKDVNSAQILCRKASFSQQYPYGGVNLISRNMGVWVLQQTVKHKYQTPVWMR